MDAAVSKYRIKMRFLAKDVALIGNKALASDIMKKDNQNEDDFLNYILKPLSLTTRMDRKTVYPLKIDVSLTLNHLGLSFTHD
jgi:hypothetical protein